MLIENRVCRSSIGRSIDACTQEGVVVWYRFGPKESDLILWHSGKHVHDIMPVKQKACLSIPMANGLQAESASCSSNTRGKHPRYILGHQHADILVDSRIALSKVCSTSGTYLIVVKAVQLVYSQYRIRVQMNRQLEHSQDNVATHLVIARYVSADKTESLCWILFLRWLIAHVYNKSIVVLQRVVRHCEMIYCGGAILRHAVEVTYMSPSHSRKRHQS